MTLVNTRAAFEKAVTDAVSDVDPTVLMVYDNVHFTSPGKTKKYSMIKNQKLVLLPLVLELGEIKQM